MTRIVALAFFLFFSLVSFSQVSVKGIIKDSTGTAIASSSIELYSGNQSARSIVADRVGIFSISNLKVDEKYLLQVSAVGYESQALSLLLQKDTVLNIVLAHSNTMLNEVTVTSKAKLIDVKPDKTVVNLADNLTIVGGSVAEALQKIPGIQMNNDKVSIPGRGDVQLMLDGRLIQLSQKDLVNYLKSIAVGNVSKIEIITSPSAAYDAAGNAGLINIITKRSKQQGYSGSIQAGYKQWQNYPGMDVTGNINYNAGKWNIFANGNVYRIRHKYGYRWEEYYPDRSWVMSDTGDYVQQNAVINVGADYRISSKSSIGFNAGYSRYYEGGADYVRNHFYNQQGGIDSLLTTYADYYPVAKTQSYSAYYKTRLDSAGTTFSIDGSYLRFYRTDHSHFTGKTFTPDGELIPTSTARYVDTALQVINIYAVKADLEIPTKFAKWQLGAKINFINTYDKLKYYHVDGQENFYDKDLSSEYKYIENTQALYLNAIKEMNDWTLQAGVRGEMTQTNGYSYLINQRNKNNYFQLFPNVLVNYKSGNANSFSFTFNRRINRPTFWNLNPYKSLMTAYSYAEGNPFLQPEYNSNFQLMHTYKNKLTSAFFIAITHNGFADVTIANADTNFVLRTPKNFANTTRYGISETYSFSTFRWWESNNLFSVYYTNGKSTLDYIAGMKGWGAYLSSSNNFYFNNKKTYSAAVNFWYQFPEVIQVNKSPAYYNVDIGFNAVLLQDKLSLNANVQDVFGTSASSYTNVVNNIRQKYATLQLNRNYSLTLIFKFGKKNTAVQERTDSNQEERKRI